MNFEDMQKSIYQTMANVAFLALTIWREVRNESFECMLAVGFVVKHRAEKPGGWGKSVQEVLFHPWAFSSLTDPHDLQLTKWPAEDDRWAQCLQAAGQVLFGTAQDPVPGAVFYHSFPKEDPPRAWGKVQLVKKIDAVWFFKQ